MSDFTEPQLIDSHEFTPKPAESRDDFRCERCNKPRALHLRTGHIPNNQPSGLPMDQAARYRGGDKPVNIL